MKLKLTFLFIFIAALGCKALNLVQNVDPDLEKFFHSLNPVKNAVLKKDSKSILMKYMDERKTQGRQMFETEAPLQFKLKNKVKLPLTTSGKNVVGLMHKVEKLIKKSIKKSDKTMPNIDFNEIDKEPIINKELSDKWDNEYLTRTISNHYSESSGSGFNLSSINSFPKYNTKYGNKHQNYKPSHIKNYSHFQHKPLNFVPKEHKKKPKEKFLNLHDFKSIWLQMIYNFHKLTERKTYIKGDDFNFKTLKILFEILRGTSILPNEKIKTVCPYSYDTAGSLCLTAEYLNESLSYDEARLYCQLIKGGDLLIIKNACEFKDVVEYLLEIDPSYSRNYWIGANDEKQEGLWRNIDGSIFPLGPPFWGKILDILEPSGMDPILLEEEDYGMMIGADFFYVHDVSNIQGATLNGVPLCQYVRQRDSYNEDREKPKGWGPYASYNEWKKHKHNSVFENYLGQINIPEKPENPFEEYGHFSYEPPSVDLSKEDYHNGHSGESPYTGHHQGYHGKPQHEGYNPNVHEGPNQSDEGYDNYDGDGHHGSYKPLNIGYDNYNGDEEYGSYKPTNVGYDKYNSDKGYGPYKQTNVGYDKTHLENEYLQQNTDIYGELNYGCDRCMNGFPNNNYQGNPNGYPNQHYGNNNYGTHDQYHQYNINKGNSYDDVYERAKNEQPGLHSEKFNNIHKSYNNRTLMDDNIDGTKNMLNVYNSHIQKPYNDDHYTQNDENRPILQFQHQGRPSDSFGHSSLQFKDQQLNDNDKIFINNQNLQPDQSHQGIQPHGTSDLNLPEQHYIGSSVVDHNIPTPYGNIQNSFDGYVQNIPINQGFTALSPQNSFQPQLYFKGNTLLTNGNSPQTHPELLYDEGLTYGGATHSSPVQMVHSSDTHSSFLQGFIGDNSQLLPTSFTNSQSDHSFTSLQQPSDFSSYNEEISLIQPESTSYVPTPINYFEAEKYYRSEMNFPEKFSQSQYRKELSSDELLPDLNSRT